MIPRLIQILTVLVIVSTLLIDNAAFGQEERTRSSEKTITRAGSDNVNELYVAVMGEIDTPGTYRLDSSSLKLHRVIQLAHGFTTNASRAIRVIRPGRGSQTEIFSEKTDSPLMPGDLLIVVPRRSSATSGKIADFRARDSQTVRANYEEGTIRAGIQVALLNVLDYPLVLRLRPEQANARYLIQALGQPVSLLEKTRVITPDVPRRQTSDAAKQAARMEDGSVIVFEPGQVDRSRLPVTLPAPIDSDLSIGSAVAAIGLAHGQSSDLRNLGQHIFWSNSNPFDSNSRRESSHTISTDDDVPNVLETEFNSDRASNPLHEDSSAEFANPVSNELPAPIDSADDGKFEAVAHAPAPDPIQQSEASSTNVSIVQFAIVLLIATGFVGTALFLGQSTDFSDAPFKTEPFATDTAETSFKGVLNVAGGSPVRAASGVQPDIQSSTLEEHVTSSTDIASHPRISRTVIQPVVSTDGHVTQDILPFEVTNRISGESVTSPDSIPSGEIVTIPIRNASSDAGQESHETSSSFHTDALADDRRPMPEKAAQPTPLAKALFQLERKRPA